MSVTPVGTAAVALLLASVDPRKRARGAEVYEALSAAGKARVDEALRGVAVRNAIRRPR